MKKSLVFLLVAAIMLSFCALAHPGRTNSAGAHKDSSTGEYHYHHGYSAHLHTNGECPYDFKDRTGINSGTSGSSSSSTSTYTGPTNKWIVNTGSANSSSKSKEEVLPVTFGNIIMLIGAGFALGIVLLALYARKKFNEIAELNRSHEATMKHEIEAAKREQRTALVTECNNAISKARAGVAEREKLLDEQKNVQKRILASRDLRAILSTPAELDLSKGVVFATGKLNGKYYHHDENCSMEHLLIPISMVSAEALELEPCFCCKTHERPAAKVEVCISNNTRAISCYHVLGAPCILGKQKIFLSEAKRRNLKPCSKCYPPTEERTVWF